jgi:ABC-type Fe3+-hydroxamate transport system substrate-binding protein
VCDGKEDKADLLKASFDQIVFNNQLRRRYKSINQKRKRVFHQGPFSNLWTFYKKSNNAEYTLCDLI